MLLLQVKNVAISHIEVEVKVPEWWTVTEGWPLSSITRRFKILIPGWVLTNLYILRRRREMGKGNGERGRNFMTALIIRL
jgi:hypothetical protein